MRAFCRPISPCGLNTGFGFAYLPHNGANTASLRARGALFRQFLRCSEHSGRRAAIITLFLGSILAPGGASRFGRHSPRRIPIAIRARSDAFIAPTDAVRSPFGCRRAQAPARSGISAARRNAICLPRKPICAFPAIRSFRIITWPNGSRDRSCAICAARCCFMQAPCRMKDAPLRCWRLPASENPRSSALCFKPIAA